MDSSFAEFVGGITVQNSNLNELASLNKTHLKTSKFDVINNKTFNSTLFISIGESEFEIANENNTYADINIEGLEVFTSSQLHDLPYFELFYIDDKGVIKARNINVKEVIVKDDTVHHDFYVFYGQYEPSVIANNITIDTIKTHAKELNAFNLCYQSNISSHNKEKLNILIKNIQSDIQASTDQENDAYRVFGIYSEASTITGSVDLTIECITSNDHGAGIFALQQSSFTLGKTSIKNVTGGMNALGIVLQQGSRIQFNKSLEIDGIISENGSAVGLLAEDLTLNKGISITNISGKQHSYAVAAYSENPNQEKHRILISNERPDTLNVIEGDMLAAQNCEIDAEFINENSHFIGATKQLSSADLGTDGIISASFDNGSYWLVTDNSSMTNLTVGGNSYVDLGYSGASKTPKSHKVITKNFTATDGGKLIFNVDAANQDNTSQLIVDGEASGNFTAQLNVVNGNQLTNGSTWVISQNAGELTLDKDDISYQAGGATAYSLAFREDASGDADGVTTSTGNPGKWYLVHPLTDPDQGGQEGGGNNGNDGDNAGGSGSGSGNGSGSGSQKPPVTPEVDQMLSLGTSVAQATGMLNENEDLRLRMGDVRHGATDGLWVRTYARKDRAQGSFGNGFEQDTYGIHIGADHILTSDARSSWLLGGAFHYGQSDIDGAAEAGGGSADVDQYTFKGYATYMHDTGTFADFVIHAGYYDTELKGLNNPGTKNYKANFSSKFFPDHT